jgi:hypothetical protein
MTFGDMKSGGGRNRKGNFPLEKRHYSIYDMLEEMRERPAMYIGSHSIVLMRAFLDGYKFAACRNDMVEDSHPEFSEFHDWVARRFGWNESTAGWANIILQETGNDEAAALDQFYLLIDEFKATEK